MRRVRSRVASSAWLACILLAGVCAAQGIESQALDSEPIDRGAMSEANRPDVERAVGFIVDRTVTNFGAEFFRQFSAAWREDAKTAAVDVTIIERPSARFGSQIFIEQNNRAIARVFLYAGRSAAITPLAIEAARYVGAVVTNNEVQAMLANDPDLGREELPK
jgi:curli production assembly/transport component CsgE